jgi:UDP-glucose 4-epimerase
MLEHQSAEPRKPDRVVVTGAGGFVGGTIAKRLRAQDVEVLALTRRELNLLEPTAAASLQSLLRPTDSVVMVSARAPAKTVGDLMTNLRMAEPVCEALAAVTVAHLLYISSDAIYADDANPVTESSPAAPSTLHGMMHAARELMLKGATRSPMAALRPTLIYGAGDPHGGYGPNRFRREAAKGGPVQIFGEGEERRDHVAVEDVAELASLILHHRSAGALNATTGISTSFHDIAHMVAAQFGAQMRVVSIPRSGPPPHLTHRHFDITSCHKDFPSFCFTPLAEGLDRAKRQSQQG